MTSTLRVRAFRGVAAIPVFAARERGGFEREGIDVDLSFTRSSDELVAALIDSSVEIAQASPDNFIAWRDRTGAPITVWYGGSSGPISLVVRPEIADVEDLRGSSIAVDYPNTGWAPIMLGILATHGIEANEIAQVATGATRLVFDALLEGRTPAAMLNEPWATRAVAAGCRIAADHRAVAPGLQTSAGASLRPWLLENAPGAGAFLRAVIGATAWLREPSHHAEVVDLVASFLPAEWDEAEALVTRLLDPATGWPQGAAVSRDGIVSVRRLRAFGSTRPDAPDDAYMTDEIHRLVAAAT